MNDKKIIKRSAVLALIWVLIAVIALTSATFAWFTANSKASTTQMKVNSRRFNNLTLEISELGGVAFEAQDEVILNQVNGQDQMNLMPVSTADLKTFVYCTANDEAESSSVFAVLTTETNYYHARFYMMVTSDYDESANVDLFIEGLPFTNEDGTVSGGILNAIRLGIVVDDTDTYIFRQSKGADESSNAYLNGELIPANSVIGVENGEMSVTDDPAVLLGTYTADWTEDGTPETYLMTTRLNEIHKVDLYIYLEGCDPDCDEEIQLDEFDFELNFFGVKEAD